MVDIKGSIENIFKNQEGYSKEYEDYRAEKE